MDPSRGDEGAEPALPAMFHGYAIDIWHESLEQWLPKDFVPAEIIKETIFGSLYQKVVIANEWVTCPKKNEILAP